MKQPIKFGKFLYRLLITIGLFTIFFLSQVKPTINIFLNKRPINLKKSVKK